MKHAINTVTMTPHDPAGRFFPEFTRMTVYVGEHKASGPVVIDMDDRGRVTLRFDEVAVPDKPAARPAPLQKPTPIPATRRTSSR